VGAGNEVSAAVDGAGRVWVCGTQQEGACGTGVTGERIVSAGRTAFAAVPRFQHLAALGPGTRITDVACGASHTVALDAEGSVYSWGTGGYGRCGHGDAKDVLSPRLVKAFEPPRMRVAAVAAGATASYFVTRAGPMTYMAGITKKSGEANVSPKPVHDLAGWKVRAVSCGATSTLVAADSSLVVWGPSPTCGELGIGEAQKSSTTPKLVDDLQGTRVLAVASGQAASLIVVDATSATKEGALARAACAPGGRFPVYAPAEPPAAAAGGGAGAGGEDEEGAAVSGKKRGAAGGGAARGGAAAAAKRGRK